MARVSKSPPHPLVGVLGPLRITRRGAEQPVTDRAMRVVLSALVADLNRGVPADTLVELAWAPHERPANPLDALETRITRLRTLLAPAAELAWTAGGCVLSVDAERVDAVCFERMAEAARWCTPREAISTLERALALWRGEPFPDLRRNGVEHPEAVRLRQLRARAVEDLAACELDIGSVEDAAGRLLALLSSEPLRERACGYAMWALHRLGMTGDAVACYDQLVERLEDELGEGVGSELRETYRAVTGTTSAVARAGAPRFGTTFTGRGHELARLSTMLHRDRLVTVTGAPGSGKTRLVLEALSIADIPATVVPLSTCDAGDLYGAVATELGVHYRGRDDAAAEFPTMLAEYLCGRRHVLVLDGCELRLTAVRALVRKLASRCADLTVVATSRVRLGLAGEQVLPLGPLARDGVRDPLASRAGTLFRDRARRVNPGYPRDDVEAEAGRAMLRRVDCLPLAVEIVAAHSAGETGKAGSAAPAEGTETERTEATENGGTGIPATLTDDGADGNGNSNSNGTTDHAMPADPTENIADADGNSGAGPAAPADLDTARGEDGHRPTPPELPTDLVEWAFSQLSPGRRDLLGALTVFAGDVSLDAAERVASTGGAVAEALTQLTRTGLLATTETGHHRVPDLVRRHAARWFAGTDGEHKARQRHALWCVDVVTEAATTAEDVAGFESLRGIQDDVCSALRWATSEEPALAAELTGLIGSLTTYRCLPKLSPWQLAVARHPDARLSRHALAAASGATAALRCGLPEEGLRLAARAAELASAPEHRWSAVRALICAYHDLGDDDRTATTCHELLALPDLPDWYEADAHAFLSLVAARGGHRHEAIRRAELATRLARESGSASLRALAAYAEATATALTDPVSGTAHLARARIKARAAAADWITASAGTALAGTLLALGRVPEAAKLLQLTLDDWLRMRAPRQLRACVDVAVRCVASASGKGTAEALVRDQQERSTSETLALVRTARAAAMSLGATFGSAHPHRPVSVDRVSPDGSSNHLADTSVIFRR
ncbi:BTAD domain-containing putative transcriptional regulator [Saccharomonospora xinjiangensis]|uniref:AfsR/SARP family transcriptional regulator n=1 Tax=Saccharomonospora xinjiangensis TaxID=75294 RepID=UPI0035103317